MATKKSAPTKKRGRPRKDSNGQEPIGNFRKAGSDVDPGKTELTNEEPTGQLRVPGQERKRNKKIEDQSIVVKNLENKRAKLLKEEVAQRAILTTMMIKADLEDYDLDDVIGEGYVCEILGEKKAKIHKRTSTEP
jgi:hypothetical protein